MSDDASAQSRSPLIVTFESLGKVPTRLGARVSDACRRALAAILASRTGAWRMVIDSADPHRELALQLAGETGLATQLTDAAGAGAVDGRLLLFEGEQPEIPATASGRAAIQIAVRARDGQRWESDRTGQWQPPVWLEETLVAAHTTLAEPAEAIFSKTDELAQSTAPDTRRSGKTLVMIEALCVVLPVVWLVRTPLNLPPMLAAFAGLASPLLIVSFCWWLRWRSMGRLWSRARLVAEACRSLLATRDAPAQPVIGLLSVVPALRPLLRKFAAELPSVSPKWRDAYLRDRLDGQYDYYVRQRDKALRERKSLTRWSTLLMDVALAVGVGGVIVTLHPRSASWLSLLGGSWLDFALGMAGLALPLGLLVAQSLRLVGDSTRRTSRYTQQILHLGTLRTRLAAAGPEDAIHLLREAEDALLSEVLDWYFQAETTEDFYTIREQSAVVVPGQAESKRTRRFAFLWTGLRHLGTAAGFFVRVVLGRLIWVVLTAALVLMWISLKQPETPDVASRLSELGRMLSPLDGTLFVPQTTAAANGTLVLAHGMRDGWSPARADGTHWSSEMSERVRKRLGSAAPQVLFLDWHEGAKASSQHGLNTQDPLTRFLADIAGVKSNGQTTGDFFGIRLVRLVENGQIRNDRPLHLVGHSAGGFVVARAAHILVAMGFPRELIHVTILDTPEPDAEITQRVASLVDAEFYRTSDMVQFDPRSLNPRLRFRDITPPTFDGAGTFGAKLKAHSYAWQWYRDSILTAKPGDEGFGRSPFCR